MVHYENDYQFGATQQKLIFPEVKDFFDVDNIKMNDPKFAKYDYTSDDAEFEVKSRKIKKNAYSTTMLTCNKVTETEKAIIFIFNFLDEICWIQYDADLFNTFTKTKFSRAQIEEDEKDYFYIPLKHLETIKVK
jgi:hypothetical protein